jgi:hypothetical protein
VKYSGDCSGEVLCASVLVKCRPCGLVVRVLGRSGGLGSIPGTTRKEVVGLERGPLSLVSTTEKLLDRKVAAPVQKKREYGRRDQSSKFLLVLHGYLTMCPVPSPPPIGLHNLAIWLGSTSYICCIIVNNIEILVPDCYCYCYCGSITWLLNIPKNVSRELFQYTVYISFDFSVGL